MFDQHGFYSLSCHGRVVFLEMKGAWNHETTLAFKQDILQKSSPLHGEPWSLVTDMSDWELFTPECEATIVETVKQAVANGLTREAIVNSKGFIKLHLFDKYKDRTLYFDNDIAFVRRVFTETKDALQWLQAEGVNVPNEPK
ncbi:hypothetical protein [Paraglaciecola sp. 2405UD69-4]|uniref:hypothetical protein n=1 Tax=Paraglaciecola sp. 2405UD69-4 TaxID=3391836 RepID=UPI0039C9CF1A